MPPLPQSPHFPCDAFIASHSINESIRHFSLNLNINELKVINVIIAESFWKLWNFNWILWFFRVDFFVHCCTLGELGGGSRANFNQISDWEIVNTWKWKMEMEILSFQFARFTQIARRNWNSTRDEKDEEEKEERKKNSTKKFLSAIMTPQIGT